MPKFDFQPVYDYAPYYGSAISVGKMVSGYVVSLIHNVSLQKGEHLPDLKDTYLIVFTGYVYDVIQRIFFRSVMFMDDNGEVISLDCDEETLCDLQIRLSLNEYE